MKKIIFIISLLIIAFTSHGQSQGTPIGNAKAYTPVKGAVKIDSGLYLPRKFPISYIGLDSSSMVWYDPITKHVWYHDGTSRKEMVPKSYVDSAILAVGEWGSFTASGLTVSQVYTTTVTSGHTRSFVQSQNQNAAVFSSSVTGTVLAIRVFSVIPGASNLTFTYQLK